jgi:UDP-glucose 4-epimerase
MKLAITGASGLIGSYLLHEMEETGDCSEVRRLLRAPGLAAVGDVVGDLRNRADIAKFVKDVPTLIHLANANNPRSAAGALVEDIAQNLSLSAQLFEDYARANPGGHIVFASTGGAMYSDSEPWVPRHESDPSEPTSSYAIQKLAAEQYLRAFSRRYDVGSTILRISNPYGVPLSPTRAQGLIGVAAACLQEGRQMKVFGSMDAVRDYIHLKDVVSAFRKVIETPAKPGETRTYNVGSGKGHSTREVLEFMQVLSGKKLVVEMTPADKLEVKWNVLSSERIWREHKWASQIGFETGIRALLKSQML